MRSHLSPLFSRLWALLLVLPIVLAPSGCARFATDASESARRGAVSLLAHSGAGPSPSSSEPVPMLSVTVGKAGQGARSRQISLGAGPTFLSFDPGRGEVTTINPAQDRSLVGAAGAQSADDPDGKEGCERGVLVELRSP